MVSKTGSSNIYNSHTCLEVVTTGFPKFYKPPTSLHAWWRLKRIYPNFYKPPTRLAVFKTDSPNFYMSPTRMAAVKTDSPNFYKPLTRLAVVETDYRRTSLTYFTVDKTDSPYFCYHPKCLRWSERTVRTSTSLLLACRRSNQTLRTSTSLTTRLAGVKTDSPYFYKPPTR